MAVTRVILPRKNLVQSAHGQVSYEADQDNNWLLLDTNVVFLSDLNLEILATLGANGVAAGFMLSTASSLVPGLTKGVLFAQGVAYAPAVGPTLAAAPANMRNYLFYNSVNGFYYQASGTPATAGDALVGVVYTNGTKVTQVTQATRIGGAVSVTSLGPGAFSVPHLLGRAPVLAVIQKTSAGDLWFQSGNKYDAVNLNLAANDVSVTADVIVF